MIAKAEVCSYQIHSHIMQAKRYQVPQANKSLVLKPTGRARTITIHNFTRD